MYTKFKELEPQGELARKRSGTPPLNDQIRIAMQEALQVICTYEKNSRGNGRAFGSVGILGRPQNTDAERNHQATVAWLAADFIVNDNANTSAIYMDRSINEVLRALGEVVTDPMSDEGSKPDLIRVRPDGKLDLNEVQRKASQNDDFMDGLVSNIKAYLSEKYPNRLGNVRWTPVTKTETDLYGVLLPS